VEIEGALIAEEGEVELGDSFAVGEEVDLDDLPVLDGEGADGERLAVTDRDGSGRAVDQRALCDQPAPRCNRLEPGPSVRYRYAHTGRPSTARFLSSKT
jgi:hypothetical protein